MKGSFRKCPACGAPFQAVGAKACKKCGTEFHGKLRQAAIRWERGVQSLKLANPDGSEKVQETPEVARTFDQVDVRGAFEGGVLVELGSQATVLLDGRPSVVLGPGYYDIESQELAPLLTSGSPKFATVILTDAGQLSLGYTIEENSAENPAGLLSADHIPVSVKVGISVRIVDLNAFVANILHGPKASIPFYIPPPELPKPGGAERAPRLDSEVARGRVFYTAFELMQELAGPLRDAVTTAIRNIPIVEMFTGAGVRKRVEEGIREVLAPVLKRGGFEMASLGMFVPMSPALQAKLREKGETTLAQFDLENSKARLDLLKQLQGIEREKFASESELEIAMADIHAKAQSASLHRENSLVCETTNLDAALEMLRLEKKQAIDEKGLAWQRGQERLELEYKLENKRIELLTNLRISGEAIDDELRLERLHLEADLTKKLKLAQSEAEIEQIRLGTKRAHADEGLRIADAIQKRELEAAREIAALIAEQTAKGVSEHLIMMQISSHSPESLPLARELLAQNRELMEAKAAARAAEGKAEGLREGIAAAANVVGRMQNVNVTQLPPNR
jgi:hypothetical protein